MTLSCIVFEIKRNIGQKSRFFHIPPVFDANGLARRADYSIF